MKRLFRNDGVDWPNRSRLVIRAFVVSLLILLQTGCGSYIPAVLTSEDNPRSEPADLRQVQEGSTVRIEMRDGEIVEGEVSRVTENFIALGKVGNYGFEEEIYHAIEIEKVEVYEGKFVESLMMTIAGAIALTFAVFVIAVKTGNFNID